MKQLAISFLAIPFLAGAIVVTTPDGSSACNVGLSEEQARKTAEPASGRNPEKSKDDKYLMLVSSVSLTTLTQEGIAQFDRSSYEGVAVPFLNAYETGPIPSAQFMQDRISEWKKVTKKDLWPWVYLNRIIGPDPARKQQFERLPYFTKIRGADLEGQTEARKDFLEYWRNSLRAARNTQSPGIVVDLEFYNFYPAYDLGVLAREMGKKPDDAVTLLKQLGHRMAEIVADEYPTAKIWFLFTDLGNPAWKLVDGRPFYASPAYVVLGLLDGIEEKGTPATIVSGGEVGLGYCHSSLAQLQMKIKNRATGFAPALSKYTGVLELAGTLTLFSDENGKSGWMKERCTPSDASNVEELQPYLKLLMKTYRYNWIYASGTGGYYAFRPNAPDRFDVVIAKSKMSAVAAKK
jgi:hypothetical protein